MAGAETITIHLNYKKCLREVFFHHNKKRSASIEGDSFDMYQIYEYVPETQANATMTPTRCSTDCTDETKLQKVLAQMMESDASEMQQMIRSCFKNCEFGALAIGDDS